MLITPAPFEQISLLSFVRQGWLPAKMPGLVGVHVPAGINIQGCGVRTPIAAAVAAATCGLAKEVHIPKGVILAGCAS